MTSRKTVYEKWFGLSRVNGKNSIMLVKMMTESEFALLHHMNPRRFAVLIHAASLGRFTASDFRQAYPRYSSSLTRDLNALEAAGLLIADPPASVPRQGQHVLFTVAEDVPSRFIELANIVSDAWQSRA